MNFVSGSTWGNVNRTTASLVSTPDEVVGIVTYGTDKIYHEASTPKFVCRYENENGDRLYSHYSSLAPTRPGSPYFNIDCSLPNATTWPMNKVRATVTVWFLNETEIPFLGRKNIDNQIEFITDWTSYTYDLTTEDVRIAGIGFDPKAMHKANFTWPNQTKVLSIRTKPRGIGEIVFNMKNYSASFGPKQSVRIELFSPRGKIPYAGMESGDSIMFETVHDACKPNAYRLISDDWRKTSNTNQRSLRCDRWSNLARKWFRIDDSIGGRMPESCMPLRRCGTNAPGWLQGTHPTEIGVEVSDKICYRWTRSCCQWSANVKIVNCGSYYVYYVPKFSNACYLAFCGDKD